MKGQLALEENGNSELEELLTVVWICCLKCAHMLM